jgi:hypothetical protein
MTKVLIAGTPRSGTTWVGQTLGRAEGARYVHEPDGDYEPYALKVKRGRPRHLELAPDEDDAPLEKLWRGAFAGGVPGRTLRARLASRLFDSTPRATRLEARRSGKLPPKLAIASALTPPLGADETARHVVAKTVHSSLCVEWIAKRFDPVVIVVDRHPLNALASWHELNQGVDAVEYAQLRDVARWRWSVALPREDAPRIARQAAFLGTLRGALNESLQRHPEWISVRHDDLLADPNERLSKLCAQAGLTFSDASRAYLVEANQPGEGYATKRVASELAHRWRSSLNEEQVDLALSTLRAFPPHLRLLDAVDESAP